MLCQLVRSDLLAYHGGSLSGWRQRLVARHLARCPDCSEEYGQLVAFDQSLRQMGLEAQSASLPPLVCPDFPDSPAREAVEQRRAGLRSPGLLGSRRRHSAWRLATAVATLLILFSLAPQLTPLAADMPLLGSLVRRVILQDAGLRWAYDHGYMLTEPLKAQAMGYEVTVVGYVADPIQTAVIVLVNGPGEGLAQELAHPDVEIPDSLVWVGVPERTPLGNLYVIGSSPLPAVGAQVEVRLRVSGKSAELGLSMHVTPEQIARVSTEKMLNRSIEQVGHRWTVERVVETPAQRMYQLVHDLGFQLTQAPVLVTDQGVVPATDYGTAYGTDSGIWRRPVVFERGENRPLELRLEGLLQWQSLDASTAIDAGSEQLVSINDEGRRIDVQVLRWPGAAAPTDSPPGFDLSVSVKGAGYEDYPGADLIEWQLRTAGGKALHLQDLMEHGYGVSHSSDGEHLLHLRIPVGVRVVAFEVTRIAVPYDPVVIDLR